MTGVIVQPRPHFRTALFVTETSDETQTCVCPCRACGHRSDRVCRIGIEPGERFYVILRPDRHRRRAVICSPCWDAINTAGRGPMPRARRKVEMHPSPAGLSRLVPLTAEYLGCLRASLPELEALAGIDGPGSQRDAQDALLDCVKAALEIDDNPGTPASISAMLAAVARSLGQGRSL